jgi:hypothetical protein
MKTGKITRFTYNKERAISGNMHIIVNGSQIWLPSIGTGVTGILTHAGIQVNRGDHVEVRALGASAADFGQSVFTLLIEHN